MELVKEILKFRDYPTSSSAEADFLNLSYKDMRSIKALVTGGNLLNERQCRDLSRKLSKTVGSIEELVVHCGGSTDRFRPAMEYLYQILEKAKLLVDKCCKVDWITEAVFQIENAQDFQVLLLEVGLCYHAIYEQAKDMSDARTFEHEDLRKSSTFRPAPISEVREDQDALKRRLEGLASSQRNNLKPSGEHLQQYALARYLLVRWESMSQQSQTNELNLSNVISCTMGIESTDPWGNVRYLGHGAFGGVCGSKWLGIPCAKKVLDGGVNERSFLKEAGILFHLNHPHVVKFFCCGYRQEEGDFFIAMELMQMSLAKLISIRSERKIPLSYPVTIEILVQIARAMCYLHGMGVAHRDLKPQNVVVNKLTSPHLPDQYCVKLVDFGLSKVKVEASKSNNVTGPGIGTTRYRAPEAHPRGPGKVNWFKADAYSFGVTGAHLLSLEEPFENMNLGNKYAELMNGELKPEVPATCPEKLVGLLNRCWDTRPSSRPKFTEILMQLEEIRYAVLRGLLSRNQNGSEVDKELTRIEVEDEFIRIMVEEHCAIRRQHIVSTDEVIELKPPLGSAMTSDMENMACKNLDTIMPDSSFTRDVSNFHSSAFSESLSSINGDTTMLDSASARGVSVYHNTAFVEPLSTIDEVADAASGSAEHAPTLERSEYFSAPKQSMMQSRGSVSDKVELAREDSMPHWSEVSSHVLPEEGKEDENMVVLPQDLNDGIEPMEGHGESVATVENKPVDDNIGKLTWTVSDFTKISVRRHYSETFVVGGYKWRVLLSPGLNDDDQLSIYLDCADSVHLPSGWTIYAHFSFAVVNQYEPMMSVRKDTKHQFNVRKSDRGFTSFMPLQELYEPSHGFLVNDTLLIEADVNFLEIRLEIEQEEKERRRKDTVDAHLYTVIKIARDEDFANQIGKHLFFDLVDHEAVRSYRIQREVPFKMFKEEVAKDSGIPVSCQKFWLWARRQDHTYRPRRPLTEQEEMETVGKLRETSTKAHNAELKLWLEVNLTDHERIPAPVPERTKEDILLFFKLYHPEREELRFVGRLFVKSYERSPYILEKLCEMAGFMANEELRLFEEIKFEPTVLCKQIDKKSTFRGSQLENGDIICYQKALTKEEKKNYRYPDVPSFLEYVCNRQCPLKIVRFRRLEKPKEDEFCLELSKQHTYDDVVERVALKLGLEDPSKLRLTSHNCDSQQPKPQPIEYRGVERLSDMLGHYNQTSDILYFETCDFPLPELQGLKTLKIAYHNFKTEGVSAHNIRLPKQSTVSDVINELKTKVELSSPTAELRILQLFHHRIFKIFPLKRRIKYINDQNLTLRAEEIPEEEKELGPQDCLIHVCHFLRDPAQNQMVQNFGEPFLLVVRENETLVEVKVRVQNKLQVSDDEFSKYKFAVVFDDRPEYLKDEEVVASKFPGLDIYYAWEFYLGLEHSDSA